MDIKPLTYYTPLRYPGGKGKLTPFIKSVIETNSLLDGYYVEPFAGGAAVGLELLFHEYVTNIYINDVCPSIGAFWRSVLDNTESLSQLIRDTPVDMDQWHIQKKIQDNPTDHDDLKLGFSTFFLNRTNRSGILKGGVIGGKNQDGPWKLDARYNSKELVNRIQAIANQRRRISFSQLDAVDFLKTVVSPLPSTTLVYLDPPYFVKGKGLYHHHYTLEDHKVISELVPVVLEKQKWIVSYDDVPEIRNLYEAHKRVSYLLTYSAQSRYQGSEVMFFNKDLVIPALCKPMRLIAA